MFYWKVFAAGNLTQLTWIKSLKTSKFFWTLKFCIKLEIFPAKETRNLLWKNTSDPSVLQTDSSTGSFIIYALSVSTATCCILVGHWTLRQSEMWHMAGWGMQSDFTLYCTHQLRRTTLKYLWSWVHIEWFPGLATAFVTPEVSLKQQSCHIYFLMALMDGWEGWAGVFPPAPLLSPSPLCTWAAYQAAPEQP